MISSRKGHCLCGKMRFELSGPENWVGHCHCESCRRATASPFTTWIGQPNGKWTLTGSSLKTFSSRADVTRGFCGDCGTPLFYQCDKYPDETHFYVALLENPKDVTPSKHFFKEEALSWVSCLFE